MDNDKILDIFMFVLVIVFTLGILTNTIVMSVFFRNPKLRKPVNFFTIAITLVNLLCTLFHMPFIIAGTLMRHVVFDRCNLQGFLFFLFGSLSIILLMILSLERYWIVTNPFKFHRITFRLCWKIMFICLAFCALWSSFPLVGWSRYSVEISGMYCSMEFNDHSWDVISFNIASITVVWGIPLMGILYTNIKIFLILRDRTNELKFMYLNSRIEFNSKKFRKRKSRQLVIVILLTIGYVIAWTPYCILMLYRALTSLDTNVKLVYTILPTLAQKTTVVWCPLLEMLFNSSVRKNLLFIQNTKKDKSNKSREKQKFIERPKKLNLYNKIELNDFNFKEIKNTCT